MTSGEFLNPYNDKFDMAIFIVNRNEKAIRTKVSREPSLVGFT